MDESTHKEPDKKGNQGNSYAHRVVLISHAPHILGHEGGVTEHVLYDVAWEPAARVKAHVTGACNS